MHILNWLIQAHNIAVAIGWAFLLFTVRAPKPKVPKCLNLFSKPF